MAAINTGRRRAALQAAQQTLDDLGVDQTKPVDVFDAIDRLGLDLTFMPLSNLMGAILPSGGVLITTRRPTSVQRYTAAHEIGHWILDQERLALDSETEINGVSDVAGERLAQLFATYFLMPPPLVRGTAARHGVRPGTSPTPAQAYLISRDVGASYEALVRQLNNLRYYPWPQVEALLRIPVLQAKQQAAFGRRPDNGRADVWPVEAPADGAHLRVAVDDELVLALPENRTTGYRWLTAAQDAARAIRASAPPPPPFSDPPEAAAEPSAAPLRRPARRPATAVRVVLSLLPSASPPADQSHLQPSASDSALRLVADAYHPGWAPIDARGAVRVRRRIAGDDSAAAASPATPAIGSFNGAAPSVGGTGRRILAVRAMDEGTHTFSLSLAPPYDARVQPVITLTVTATVAPGPVLLNRRRILDVDLDERLPTDPPDDAVFAVLPSTDDLDPFADNEAADEP